MKAENRGAYHNQTSVTHHAEAGGDRRGHSQGDTPVRHDAEKAADESQEIKIGYAKKAENHNAANAHEEADGEVAGDEAFHHGGDTSQGDVSSGAIFRAEQLHGLGPGVLLPAQHEVGEKRDK